MPAVGAQTGVKSKGRSRVRLGGVQVVRPWMQSGDVSGAAGDCGVVPYSWPFGNCGGEEERAAASGREGGPGMQMEPHLSGNKYFSFRNAFSGEMAQTTTQN